jgi:hypothetical protein
VCGLAGAWLVEVGNVTVERVGFWLLAANLRFSLGSLHSFDGDADSVDPVMAGPTVDSTPVVADLHAASRRVERGHQMQINGSGDSGQDDVTDLQPGGVHWSDSDQVPAPDQRNHRGSRRTELHPGSAGYPADYGVHSSHQVRILLGTTTVHCFSNQAITADGSLDPGAGLSPLPKNLATPNRLHRSLANVQT